ncbi:MAG: hypothetical protein LBL61_00150 [Elusimicrobiota bacterium]|jgi:hypothetical protein|nr:hypothetical protein [Elusimicrobiota bacterium]
MKNLILFFVLFFAALSAFAAAAAGASPLPSIGAAAVPAEDDDDIKKLVLKYDAAEPSQKNAARKELEKLVAAKEAEAVKKTDARIKRQEAKIQEIKKNNEERKKNAANINAKQVERLLSKESVEKIKDESLKQNIAGKAENRK